MVTTRDDRSWRTGALRRLHPGLLRQFYLHEAIRPEPDGPGAPGFEYMVQRGIPEADVPYIVERFGVRYCPESHAILVPRIIDRTVVGLTVRNCARASTTGPGRYAEFPEAQHCQVHLHNIDAAMAGGRLLCIAEGVWEMFLITLASRLLASGTQSGEHEHEHEHDHEREFVPVSLQWGEPSKFQWLQLEALARRFEHTCFILDRDRLTAARDADRLGATALAYEPMREFDQVPLPRIREILQRVAEERAPRMRCFVTTRGVEWR